MAIFSNFGSRDVSAIIPLSALLDFPEFPTIFRSRFRSGRILAGVRKMRCVNVLARIREAWPGAAGW